MRKQNNLFFMLNIMIPILMGIFIYLFYSPNTIFVKFVNTYINIIIFDRNVFIDILRNYFCDFCWSYSLSFTISYIYKNQLSIITTIVIPVSVGLCLEILQLTSLTSGTYDLLDIFMESLASVICYLVLKKRNEIKGEL